MALYGMTAKEFKQNFPDKKGNLRDNSSIEQLMIMNNLQVLNSEMLRKGMPVSHRLRELNRIALEQQAILQKNNQKALRDLRALE